MSSLRTSDDSASRVRALSGDLIREVVDRYSPGQRLPTIDALAAERGVSRSVVREALGVLAAKGLIEVRHGEGSYVRKPDLRELEEWLRLLLAAGNGDRAVLLLHLMELRELMEPAVSRLAAQRATAEDLSRLRRLLQSGVEAAEKGDREAILLHDREFHAAIAETAHNPLLALVQTLTAPLLEEQRRVVVGGRDELRLRGHRAIVAALVRRDPEAAARAASEHVRQVNATLRRGLLQRT